MDLNYTERFAGVARLVGSAGLARLREARVAVVGLGGVGSWTVEALARSGVGALTLIDLDEICVSNTNRQIHTLTDTIGQTKAAALARRVAQIQPSCQVSTQEEFFTRSTAEQLLSPPPDVVVDAIDSARNKALLIAQCHKAGIPLVVCGGAGGRMEPGRMRVDDLNRTGGDALLRRIRGILRKEHGFPGEVRWGIPAIFSDEPVRWVDPEDSTCSPQSKPTQGFKLDCSEGYGAASFVTGVMGMWAAREAVRHVLKVDPSEVDQSG